MLKIASQFPHARGYLDTPTYGLPAAPTVAAMHAATDAWATGALDPVALDGTVARLRAAFATLTGTEPEDVALAGSTSQVVGMVAASLPDGARVLVAEGDFASVGLPFASDPRLEVRAVPLERLVDAVRPGIDLVAVSAVQSSDGRLIDLAALATTARLAGVRTLVDTSHAAGWLPLAARDFDVTVASAYKWLGAPRGIALATVRPEASWVRPVYASWYGADRPWEALYGHRTALSQAARRLDASPAWQTLEAGAVALELLAAEGVAAIHAHSVGLADGLREALGLAPAGSAIVSLPLRSDDALARAGLRAAVRAGRARLGFYVHSSAAEVEAAGALWHAEPSARLMSVA